MHEVEVGASRSTLPVELFVIELDDVVVFAVHHDDAVSGRYFLHEQPDAAEIHLVRAPRRLRRKHVAGEDFEARETRLDQLGHLIERFDRRAADEIDVERVVN